VASLVAAGAGGLVYLAVLAVLRADELGELRAIVRGRRAQSSPVEG
jgi:hypothetical protein